MTMWLTSQTLRTHREKIDRQQVTFSWAYKVKIVKSWEPAWDQDLKPAPSPLPL